MELVERGSVAGISSLQGSTELFSSFGRPLVTRASRVQGLPLLHRGNVHCIHPFELDESTFQVSGALKRPVESLQPLAWFKFRSSTLEIRSGLHGARRLRAPTDMWPRVNRALSAEMHSDSSDSLHDFGAKIAYVTGIYRPYRAQVMERPPPRGLGKDLSPSPTGRRCHGSRSPSTVSLLEGRSLSLSRLSPGTTWRPTTPTYGLGERSRLDLRSEAEIKSCHVHAMSTANSLTFTSFFHILSYSFIYFHIFSLILFTFSSEILERRQSNGPAAALGRLGLKVSIKALSRARRTRRAAPCGASRSLPWFHISDLSYLII